MKLFQKQNRVSPAFCFICPAFPSSPRSHIGSRKDRNSSRCRRPARMSIPFRRSRAFRIRTFFLLPYYFFSSQPHMQCPCFLQIMDNPTAITITGQTIPQALAEMYPRFWRRKTAPITIKAIPKIICFVCVL